MAIETLAEDRKVRYLTWLKHFFLVQMTKVKEALSKNKNVSNQIKYSLKCKRIEKSHHPILT